MYVKVGSKVAGVGRGRGGEWQSLEEMPCAASAHLQAIPEDRERGKGRKGRGRSGRKSRLLTRNSLLGFRNLSLEKLNFNKDETLMKWHTKLMFLQKISIQCKTSGFQG